MKYLGIHKLLWFLLVLFFTLIQMMIVGVMYIAYIIWNFKLPEGNLWYNVLSGRSDWDFEMVTDHNPWQTIKRRYKFIED